MVEVDGSWRAHRSAADRLRDIKLGRLGFTVLRLHAELVERQLLLALQRIREVVAALSAAK